jgi:hypothetical protein
MVIMITLVWALVASHCRIAALPGMAFLQCSQDVHGSNESGDPCQDHGCCAVESAKYHAPRQQDLLPEVLVAILPPAFFEVVDHSLPTEVSVGVLVAAPPDLPTAWQFIYRTALPPRAPSHTV